jgi:hypothetical protein
MIALACRHSAKDSDIFLQCSDPDAVLDDKSGRNFFPMQCQGTKVGTVDTSGAFTAAAPTFVFPKCLSR